MLTFCGLNLTIWTARTKKQAMAQTPTGKTGAGDSTAGPRILEVKLSELQPNPFQPRKDFDAEALQELADSIKESGLIQPIAVIESDVAGYPPVGPVVIRQKKLPAQSSAIGKAP